MTERELKVLVVDDNRSAANALARVLRKRGDRVDAVYDGGTAIERIREDPPDIVLTDLKMEPVDGMSVLQAARAQRPPVEVIVFTAYGAVDVAVKAMRHGARDFLTKPVTADQVSHRLEQLRAVPEEPTEESGEEFVFVARSHASKHLLDQLRKAADVPSPMWIEGDIGSGRGHAAMALHRFGGSDGSFIIRDVGRSRPWPERGTVLLPNVDDLPDDLQKSLHRSLQQLPKGVRVIATAGPDGQRRKAEGTLRPELYYALAVVVIQVPPLRQRKEDILPMLEMALDDLSRRYGRPRPRIERSQVDALLRHAWPGNVRELLNLAERAVVMGANAFDLDVIEVSPDGLPRLEPGFSLSSYLESVEKQILVEALRKSGGDRAEAGRILGVERNTLRYKLNKYGLLDR